MAENPLADLGHEATAKGPGGVPVWALAGGLAAVYLGVEWWRGRGTSAPAASPATPPAIDGGTNPDGSSASGDPPPLVIPDQSPWTITQPITTPPVRRGRRTRVPRRGGVMPPRRQRPKRSKRTPRQDARQDARQESRQDARQTSRIDTAGQESRQDARQEARQDARRESRIDQRMNERIAANSATAGLNGGGFSNQPSAGTAPTAPGTTGTSVETPTDYTYSWVPEGERHAVTTSMEPDVSWPPVDLPPLSGFTTDDLPMDNGQSDPETLNGGGLEVSESQYNFYDETGYPG